eukprot:PhF_6_TR22269/c0_g1_i1/m.31487
MYHETTKGSRDPDHYLNKVNDYWTTRETQHFRKLLQEANTRWEPPKPENVTLPAAFYESTERAHARWNGNIVVQKPPTKPSGKSKRPVLGLLAPDAEINTQSGSNRVRAFVTSREVHRCLRSQLHSSENRLKSCKFGGLTEVSDETFVTDLPSLPGQQSRSQTANSTVKRLTMHASTSVLDTPGASTMDPLGKSTATAATTLTSFDGVFHLTNVSVPLAPSPPPVLPTIEVRKLAHELGRAAKPKTPDLLVKTTGAGSPQPTLDEVEDNFVKIQKELTTRGNEIHSRAIDTIVKDHNSRREAFYAKSDALTSVLFSEMSSVTESTAMTNSSSHHKSVDILRSVRSEIDSLQERKELQERTVAFEAFFAVLQRTVELNAPGCRPSAALIQNTFRMAHDNKYVLTPQLLVNYLKSVENVAFLLHSFQSSVRLVAPLFGFTHQRCENILKERLSAFDAKPIDFLGDGRIEGRLRFKILLCKGSFLRDNKVNTNKRYSVMLKHEYLSWKTAARTRPCWGEEFVVPFTTPTPPMEVQFLESGGTIGMAKVDLEELYVKSKMIKITVPLVPTGAEVLKMELVMMSEPAPDPYVHFDV